jgi:hypothetical protein
MSRLSEQFRIFQANRCTSVAFPFKKTRQQGISKEAFVTIQKIENQKQISPNNRRHVRLLHNVNVSDKTRRQFALIRKKCVHAK